MKAVFRALCYTLSVPVVIAVVAGSYIAASRYFVDEGTPPGDIVWQHGDVRQSVHVDDHRQGEIQTLGVTVRAANGTVVHRRDLEIDWDMWGAGFVRGLQVDADPELELVMVRSGNAAGNVYLDASATGILERPLADASDEARATVDRWFELRTESMMLAGLGIVAALLWILGSVVYYCLATIRYAWRRRRA